jgi:hypothetical protein
MLSIIDSNRLISEGVAHLHGRCFFSGHVELAFFLTIDLRFMAYLFPRSKTETCSKSMHQQLMFTLQTTNGCHIFLENFPSVYLEIPAAWILSDEQRHH